MSTPHPPAPDLSAYALAVLSPAEVAAVDAHLNTCASCRRDLDDLIATTGQLGDVPPEFFLDGPPEGAELLMARTIGQVRGERSARDRAERRRTRAPWLVAAAVAGVVLVGGGVLAGRALEPKTATAATVPGTRYAALTDATTGARMAVSVIPAAGWVRVHAKVTGIPSGEMCRIVVVGAGTQREVAGSWLVSPKAARDGSELDGFALIAPGQVSAVVVENFAGHQFVSVPIT